jgi:hypothetical protein
MKSLKYPFRFTKLEVINSILLLARKYDLEENYKYIIEHEKGEIQNVIQMISYIMFLNNYHSYFEKDNELFKAYEMIRTYGVELKKEGFVRFK